LEVWWGLWVVWVWTRRSSEGLWCAGRWSVVLLLPRRRLGRVGRGVSLVGYLLRAIWFLCAILDSALGQRALGNAG
jgi:hypothetical protein